MSQAAKDGFAETYVKVITVVTPREILPEAKMALAKHGCVIVPCNAYSEVVFPNGTTRKEILPRMPQSERYMLALPDGYVIEQVWV